MKTLACVVACVLIVGSLFAQNNSGTIQGTVTDPDGAVLAGANISVKNMDTGATVNSQTSGAGVYSVPNLPPGRYSVTVDFRAADRAGSGASRSLN